MIYLGILYLAIGFCLALIGYRMAAKSGVQMSALAAPIIALFWPLVVIYEIFRSGSARRFDRDQDGQGTVEYCLLYALIGAAAVITLHLMGFELWRLFENLTATVSITGR